MTGDIVQLDINLWKIRSEPLDDVRQNVQEGGFSRRDIQRSSVNVAESCCEAVGQTGKAINQWLGHLQQQISCRGQTNLWPTTFEKQGIKFLFQCLNL